MSRISSPAGRRYVTRLAALMAAYLVLLFVAVRLFRSHSIDGVLAYPVAIAPALPVIGMFWAVMRLLVEETDEYVRMLYVRQALVATGFCLTVMTVWEFLGIFDLASPPGGGFGAAMVWLIGLGVGALYNRVTLGSRLCMP